MPPGTTSKRRWTSQRVIHQKGVGQVSVQYVRHQKGVGQVSVQYIKKALDKSACNTTSKRRWTSQRTTLDKSACNARHRISLANRHAETSSTHHRDRSTDDGSHLRPSSTFTPGEQEKRRWTSPKYTNAQRSVTVIHSPTDMPRRAALTTVAAATPATESLPDGTAGGTDVQGEQPYIDKVKEERFTRPTSRKTKPNNVVKKRPKTKNATRSLKKRAFDPSDIIKGQRGIPVKKSTTLSSLVRSVWWGKKPLLELLRKSVQLMDGQFLNKRTTLLSLMRNVPMAKKPLVDVIVNKML